jgi:heme-degrading monooxygenase HmoA
MAAFAYVWEFHVRAERVADFERTYGPRGEWVQLFRRSPAYIRTELHRDERDPRRFITVDHWQSRAQWTEFREAVKAEFDALDRRCEEMTEHETLIGCFEPVE